MIQRNAKDLVFMFWDRCTKEGRKIPKTYGIVSTKATEGEPVGTLVGWGVNRGYVENRLAILGNSPAAYEIEELEQ